MHTAITRRNFIKQTAAMAALAFMGQNVLAEQPQKLLLPFTFRGASKKVRFTVDADVIKMLESEDRRVTYMPGVDKEPTVIDVERATLKRMIHHQQQFDEIKRLCEIVHKFAQYDDDNAVRMMVSLVQNIPYKKYNYTNGDAYYQYPLEALAYGGRCSEKSNLLLVIVSKVFGYGTAAFVFNGENHQSVGIKSDMNFSYRNTGFAFIESTTPTIITYSKGNYLVGYGRDEKPIYIKLKSKPLMYTLNAEGKTFDCSKEYADAIEWDRLMRMDARPPGEFAKYSSLKNYYGLD